MGLLGQDPDSSLCGMRRCDTQGQLASITKHLFARVSPSAHDLGNDSLLFTGQIPPLRRKQTSGEKDDRCPGQAWHEGSRGRASSREKGFPRHTRMGMPIRGQIIAAASATMAMSRTLAGMPYPKNSPEVNCFES